MVFTSEQTPVDIVKTFPQASDIFIECHVDFCCGGDVSLAEQFAQKQLPGDAILNRLNESFIRWSEQGNIVMDWDEVSTEDLIDHIVHHHHAYLKEELPALETFVIRIANVHGEMHPHLIELHDVYQKFKKDMGEHSLKEELEVFPLIKQYLKAPSDELLTSIHLANGGLEDEHDLAGNLLIKMRQLTNGFDVPTNACGSYRITYDRLAKLETDTFQHVHLENNILFKRF